MGPKPIVSWPSMGHLLAFCSSSCDWDWAGSRLGVEDDVGDAVVVDQTVTRLCWQNGRKEE